MLPLPAHICNTATDEEIGDSIFVRTLGNPSTEWLIFELLGLVEYPVSLSIHDFAGRDVHQESIRQMSAQHQVPIHHLATGLYLLTLKSADGKRAILKFVKN